MLADHRRGGVGAVASESDRLVRRRLEVLAQAFIDLIDGCFGGSPSLSTTTASPFPFIGMEVKTSHWMKRRSGIKVHLTWVVIEPLTTYDDPEGLCRATYGRFRPAWPRVFPYGGPSQSRPRRWRLTLRIEQRVRTGPSPTFFTR